MIEFKMQAILVIYSELVWHKHNLFYIYSIIRLLKFCKFELVWKRVENFRLTFLFYYITLFFANTSFTIL